MGILLPSLMVVTAAAIGCSGTAFEQGNSTGSDLAGAAGAASTSSIGTGGASLPAGAAGRAGGGAATGGAGEPAAAGGAGGEAEQPEPTPTACDRSGWQLKAFASNSTPAEPAAAALDGSDLSRWSSGEPRAVGQWLELELGRAERLAQLELRTSAYPSDLPSSLVVKLDGKATPATFDTSSPGVLRVAFAAREVRAVRLELDADAPSWWSVSELVGLCAP